MKKILALLPVLAIVFAMRGHASAAYVPDTNYAQIMVEAASVGEASTPEPPTVPSPALVPSVGRSP